MAETGELAGLLIERVILEEWRESRDSAGLSIGAWEPRGSLAAAVALEPASAVNTAPLSGDALRTVARWRVTLRAPGPGSAVPGLASRLWWRGERLKVLAVERDPASPDRLVLRCRSDG